MYSVQPPSILRKLYTDGVWRMNELEKKIYLTFDDGPIPEVTPWVLDVLKAHAVPATFFCVGENVKNHTTIYQRILNEHHAVGNHTYNHVDGWDTPLTEYMQNIEECAKYIDTNLFRPPYGRIRKKQKEAVSQQYTIIMWDVLSKDYDAQTSPEQCFQNACKYVRNGSIIVFHDSLKAKENMQYALPRFIEFAKKRGFEFCKL
ncbi:MAG TPA: polysaccharide deacetylase family protein [Bacteroidia bacterium]|jgi:peptidoglycan/xylan/chitin deacetylase (PgdA/CDA1 family)|nr:polysaccharide deacetylase family protein [Bacteroidia bacterium]HRG52304.1 polysaccharide deacetylase family protein [Bacteroidia bacterium]